MGSPLKTSSLMRICALCLSIVVISGCASFSPEQDLTSFEDRIQVQEQGNVIVSASVLTEEESRRFFGVDLASKQIQPVWMRVQNNDSHPYWMLATGLDPEYFSPHEVAYSMHRWLQPVYNEQVDVYFTQMSFLTPFCPKRRAAVSFTSTLMKMRSSWISTSSVKQRPSFLIFTLSCRN